MTKKYELVYKGRCVGLAYASPHKYFKGHIMATVWPLEKEGKWRDQSLEIVMANPIHDIFPEQVAPQDAIREILGQMRIDPRLIEIHEQAELEDYDLPE